jgi:hypothetical protein
MQVKRIGLAGKPGAVQYRAAHGWKLPTCKPLYNSKVFKKRRGVSQQVRELEQHLEFKRKYGDQVTSDRQTARL